MKRIVFLGILIVAAVITARAQTVYRVDPSPVMTTAGTGQPGGYPALYAVAGATINICTDAACTIPATTYANSTASVACPVSAPVVQAGTSVCTPFAGPQGQFGFWLTPGIYFYRVIFPNGQSFGNFGLSTPAQGITAITAGAGISATGSGTITITNTGIVTLTAGTGISVTSGSNPTITNTGVTSITAGTGIGSTGGSTPTLSNTGVTSFNSRMGAVSPATNDYTYSQIGGTRQGTATVPQMAGTNNDVAGTLLCDDASGNSTTSGCTVPLTTYPAAGVAVSTGSAWGASLQTGLAANNLSQYNSSDVLPIGQGLLQGYGMTGTGLDTPSVAYLADGTLASPSGATYPAATWSRIANGNYTNGIGTFTFYSLKNGGSNGIETVTISSREILPSDQASLYIRNVASYGNIAIIAATNASPVVLAFVAPCYCSTGQGMHVSGATGNTAANGDWVITVIDATHASLNSSTGNGIYAGGGAGSLQGPVTITNISAGAPAVVTVDIPYNVGDNTGLIIAGVTGATNANGYFEITPISPTTFSLQGSNTIGQTYTGGGTASFFQTNWGIVSACTKFTPLDECTNEINTFNLSGVDAPAEYASGPGLMNGWAIVGGGNAKLSSAIFVDSQQLVTAAWQRGIDMINGGLVPNGPAYIAPNTGTFASYQPSPSHAITPLLWQDAALNTVINVASGAYTYFSINGIGQAYIDNGGTWYMKQIVAQPVLVSGILACSSVNEGARASVTDATTNTWGATVTSGGGSTHVGIYCDGTNWTVFAK
jgi:hypothetical protein